MRYFDEDQYAEWIKERKEDRAAIRFLLEIVPPEFQVTFPWGDKWKRHVKAIQRAEAKK